MIELSYSIIYLIQLTDLSRDLFKYVAVSNAFVSTILMMILDINCRD